MSNIKEIVVNITKKGDEHYLVFNFSEPVELSLKTKDNIAIQNIFSKLIKNLLEEKYTLKYEGDAMIEERLVKEVASKYVEQLDAELSSIMVDPNFEKLS